MFLLALESDNFSPFILEVPFGVNCRGKPGVSPKNVMSDTGLGEGSSTRHADKDD
jgi:hypothetical protein